MIHSKDLKPGSLYCTNLNNERTIVRAIGFVNRPHGDLCVEIISGNESGYIEKYGDTPYCRFSINTIFSPIWKKYPDIKFGR